MAKKNPQRYINRELSWIEFNRRVLEQAQDPAIPVLERLKFLTITASNYDEFFMVRVGGLRMLADAGRKRKDASGLTPAGQLRAISERTHTMAEAQQACFRDQLDPELVRRGIRRAAFTDLTAEQDRFLETLFAEQLFPTITPLALDPQKPFPLLKNLALHILVRLRGAAPGDADRYAVISPAAGMRRFVTLPGGPGLVYIPIEDVMQHYMPNWFRGQHIMECIPFRLTRNADMGVREDMAADLMMGMEDVLEERKVSGCVRLEMASGATRKATRFLREALGISTQAIYLTEGPVNLGDFRELAFADGFDELKDEPWPPQASPDIDARKAMVENMAEKSLLLCHPYESFDPVVRFVEEAAEDPEVLAIKQILYRTSSRSPIVSALKRAAESGKTVTVVVELKARFDEARNIDWARQLEQAGVQVLYGVRGLKTHAKICIVVRREQGRIVKYVHYGTGNYNDATARIYSDISYLTADPDLGADGTAFFNAISGYSEPPAYLKLQMAPIGIRDTMLDMIDGEIERSRQGQPARIMGKMNSLVDAKLIDRLYEASRAGVDIQLNIRGICCLRPGVKGLSENIRVTSIVDRFLEHARIYCFHRGGDPQVFISSADWMPRNLDKRIELLVPVEERRCRKKLVDILQTYFKDNTNAWELQQDGSYRRLQPHKKKAFRSQAQLYRKACDEIEQARQAGRLTFKPHRPAEENG